MADQDKAARAALDGATLPVDGVESDGPKQFDQAAPNGYSINGPVSTTNPTKNPETFANLAARLDVGLG